MSINAFPTLLLWQSLQVTIVAVIVWCTTRWIVRDRPHLAHALWALVLLKCVTPPLIPSPTSPFSWAASQTVRVPSSAVQDQLTPSPQRNPVVKSAPPAARYQLEPEMVQASSFEPPNSTTSIADEVDISKASQPFDVDVGLFVVGVWIAVASFFALFTSARLLIFTLRVRRATVATPTNVTLCVRELTERIGLRRAVRVRIVDRPMGPAVTGLLSPTLLLPQKIVQNKTQQQLAPLVAHELIHIRRGDLVWAALQASALCLWWFHPLIWLAERLLTREAERSCDEETIASLGFKPANYARCLLEVLEQKHSLQAAPSLPGIRPVDVTAKRLERIMKLGQGCHSRTPRSVTAIFLVGALIVLPGASLAWTQDTSADAKLSHTARSRLQVIRGGNGETTKKAETLESELRRHNVMAQVTGELEYTSNDDYLEITASPIFYQPSSESTIEGDKGTIRYLFNRDREPKTEVTFDGNVKVKMGDSIFTCTRLSTQEEVALSAEPQSPQLKYSKVEAMDEDALKAPSQFQDLTLDECIQLAIRNSNSFQLAEPTTTAPASTTVAFNLDIPQLKAEKQLQELTRDVEFAYWDLYAAYRVFDAAKKSQEHLIDYWRVARVQTQLGNAPPETEAQARALYHQYRAQVRNALHGSSVPGNDALGVYGRERVLANLLGLSSQKSDCIRPVSSPTTDHALDNNDLHNANYLKQNAQLNLLRAELHQRELELDSAKAQAQSALNSEFAQNTSVLSPVEKGIDQGLKSQVEYTPQAIGKRRALANIQNNHIAIQESQEEFQSQEQLLLQELQLSYQTADSSIRSAENYFQEWKARENELETYRGLLKQDKVKISAVIDNLLRSQERSSRARMCYYQAICEYNKSLALIAYSTGAKSKQYRLKPPQDNSH